MRWGVPFIPLMIVSGLVMWATTWTSILTLALLPVIILVMGQVTRNDDQMYRLIWLRWYCRLVHFNRNRKFWNATTYSPFTTKR